MGSVHAYTAVFLFPPLGFSLVSHSYSSFQNARSRHDIHPDVLTALFRINGTRRSTWGRTALFRTQYFCQLP